MVYLHIYMFTLFEMFSSQTYENKAEQIWSTIPPKLPLFYQNSFLMISKQLLKKGFLDLLFLHFVFIRGN